MKRKYKFIYLIIMIVVLAITTIGATYAYWTASTESSTDDVNTNSTIYSISMNINPLYHGFSVIPMNDTDALKALKNKCKDKYDRGACSAYNVYIYDYAANLEYISGYMDVTTNNMQNISYMMLRESDTYDENNCVEIEASNEIYCIVRDASPIGDGIKLSLGDAYSVAGTTDTKFILLIWLSNLKQSQNDIDIGTFEAVITMQAGNGGEIKGSISSVIVPDTNVTSPENSDNDNVLDNNNNIDDTTGDGV